MSVTITSHLKNDLGQGLGDREWTDRVKDRGTLETNRLNDCACAFGEAERYLRAKTSEAERLQREKGDTSDALLEEIGNIKKHRNDTWARIQGECERIWNHVVQKEILGKFGFSGTRWITYEPFVNATRFAWWKVADVAIRWSQSQEKNDFSNFLWISIERHIIDQLRKLHLPTWKCEAEEAEKKKSNEKMDTKVSEAVSESKIDNSNSGISRNELGRRLRNATSDITIFDYTATDGMLPRFSNLVGANANRPRVRSMPGITRLEENEHASLSDELKDKRELDMLYFVAGARYEPHGSLHSDEYIGPLVTDYEASHFNAWERRAIATNEVHRFGTQDTRCFARYVPCHYWLLLRHECFWQRVTYPLKDAWEEYPDEVQRWKATFVEDSIGGVIASIVLAGWIFYESSQDWFAAMERHYLVNKKNKLSNFLDLSMNSPYLHARDGIGKVIDRLLRMYVGDEDLGSRLSAWIAEHRTVCSRQAFLNGEHESTSELVSYLQFADLPFARSPFQINGENGTAAQIVKEEKLKFAPVSTSGKNNE